MKEGEYGPGVSVYRGPRFGADPAWQGIIIWVGPVALSGVIAGTDHDALNEAVCRVFGHNDQTTDSMRIEADEAVAIAKLVFRAAQQPIDEHLSAPPNLEPVDQYVRDLQAGRSRPEAGYVVQGKTIWLWDDAGRVFEVVLPPAGVRRKNNAVVIRRH